MEYVNGFNLFGKKIAQKTCIVGRGLPTNTTGEVGCFYMDENTGKTYKCITPEQWVLSDNMSIEAIETSNGHITLDIVENERMSLNSTALAVTPEMFGAIGDGNTDDSLAFKKMFDSGCKTFILKSNYCINIKPNSYTFHRFTEKNGITIKSLNGASITLKHKYSDQLSEGDSFLVFEKCKNICIDLNVISDFCFFENGKLLPDNSGNRLQMHGSSVCVFYSCSEVNVHIDANRVYTAVKFLSQTDAPPSKNINITGSAIECNYFLTAVDFDTLKCDCWTDKIHRSIYLGGGKNVTINNVFTRTYVADCNILLTTNQCGDGIVRGIENAYVKVRSEKVDMTEGDANYDPCNTMSRLTGAGGLSIGEDSKKNTCSFENILFDFDLYRDNCCGYISAIYDYDVSTKNVKFIINDYMDHSTADTQFTCMKFAGEYINKLPVTISLPNGSFKLGGINVISGDKIKAKYYLEDTKDVLITGSPTLVKNCLVDVDFSNVEDLYIYNNHNYIRYRTVNNPPDEYPYSCKVNGNECKIFCCQTQEERIENDCIGNKTSALLRAYHKSGPTNVEIYSIVNNEQILIYKGQIPLEGQTIYFSPLQSNTIKIISDKLYASIVI